MCLMFLQGMLDVSIPLFCPIVASPPSQPSARGSLHMSLGLLVLGGELN